MISAYITHILIIITIYSILAVAYNVALGYTGLLNLGHIAFFGIGAYASALLVMAGLPYLAAMLIGAAIAALFGLLLVKASDKLSGDYLALATLGFNYVIYSIMLNWTGLTRGPLGIPGIPKPEIFGLVIKGNTMFLIFALIIAIISIVLMTRIVHSRFGRLLEATRDDPTGLTMLGKNVFWLKAKGMMISAFFAGVAGSLFAHYITYIDPTSFLLLEIILILTIVIVGGLATIRGSIIGAVIIILIPEILRFVNMSSTILGPMRQIIYALILIAILLYRPKGLFGKVDLQ